MSAAMDQFNQDILTLRKDLEKVRALCLDNKVVAAQDLGDDIDTLWTDVKSRLDALSQVAGDDCNELA